MAGTNDMHSIADKWGRVRNFDFCSETEPSVTWPYMMWINPASQEIKVRNKTDTGWIAIGGTGGGDEKVKVSANDAAAGYLLPKLDAGTGIQLTELNEGGNEQVRIASNASLDDAYNAGRIITADAGAVEILGPGGLFSQGNIVLDAGAGDSPQIQLVGGSNDDTAWIGLDDDVAAGKSDLIITLPGSTNDSYLKVQALSGNALLWVGGGGNAGVGLNAPSFLSGCGLTGNILDVEGAIQSSHNAADIGGIVFGSGNNGYMLPLFFGISESSSHGMWFLAEPYHVAINGFTAAALVFEGRKRDNTALTAGDLVQFHNGGSVKARIDLDGYIGPRFDADGQADAIVLDGDGDTTISAPTDDQIDFEVGGSDAGRLVAGGWAGDTFTFVAKNTSGGAASAGDLGYIDSAGEYKTTATAYSNVAWCVVLIGGANNADIYVARRGRVVVTLNGNCNVGDYLYTSTTAKQAQPQSYARPELFAVALTANAVGAGGTCEALLLCNTQTVSVTSSVDVLYISSYSDTDWRTTINGAPVGVVVTYTDPLISGAEDSIVPAAANQYAKIRLYNETRGDYALIDSVNIVANTITLTANAPGAWANGDTITTRSQTCINPAPPPYFYDADLSSADNTLIPVLARALLMDVSVRDTAAANGFTFFHPWEAYAGSKIQSVGNQVAGQWFVRSVRIPLSQRRFCFLSNWSGASTGNMAARILGYDVAVL